jgi:Calx-beta domain
MDTRKARKSEPNDGGGEHWGLDPQDVRRYARRVREARAVGPLGKVFRVAAVALVLAGAFAVYWNFDTLREMRLDLSRVTSVFSDRASETGGDAEGEPGTEVVGDTSIAGVKMPTSLDGETPEAETPATPAPAETPAAEQPAAVNVAPAVAEARPEPEPVPQPPPEPEVPLRPETFGFGLEVMTVSEADASARVLVLRDGGRRGVSFITWWTTNGTATAGTDFARLEPVTVRFGAGEQNRTLLVPIIGDHNVEGLENFYVHFAVGESADAEPVAQIEIAIADDD